MNLLGVLRLHSRPRARGRGFGVRVLAYQKCFASFPVVPSICSPCERTSKFGNRSFFRIDFFCELSHSTASSGLHVQAVFLLLLM